MQSNVLLTQSIYQPLILSQKREACQTLVYNLSNMETFITITYSSTTVCPLFYHFITITYSSTTVCPLFYHFITIVQHRIPDWLGGVVS